MRKKILTLCMLVSISFIFSSCYTIEHTVGQGPQAFNVETQRQWFILWGLVPLNEVDTKLMAQGKSDYAIKTEWTPVDVIIGLFTGIVTIRPRTVEVRH